MRNLGSELRDSGVAIAALLAWLAAAAVLAWLALRHMEIEA